MTPSGASELSSEGHPLIGTAGALEEWLISQGEQGLKLGAKVKVEQQGSKEVVAGFVACEGLGVGYR